jgi:tetratricopeptide (TPR) repeat protein
VAAPAHWQLDQLEARLANVVAYGQHTKQDYKSAEAGFARAAALDPTWPIAAYNLASARQLQGDLAGAVAALAPWLKSDPMATYIQVASDPELAPLLARPELKALQATKRGSVAVDAKGITGDIAYSPERGELAIARREASWGACVYMVDIELHDATSGKLVAKAPLIKWDETLPECSGDGIKASARPAIAERAKLVQGILADLGFSPAAIERGTQPTGNYGEKRTSSFAKAKLGVVGKDGLVRVLRKDTELGHASTLDQLLAAVLVTDLDTVVLTTGRAGREGCEGTDPTQVDIIKLK